MKFILSDITSKIVHIGYKKQRSLTSTFLRFQEYYESPEFCDKIFTLKEFKEWYVTQWPQELGKSRFTYYSDWNGFNLPSTGLKPFYDGLFNPLTKNEREFLATFKDRFESGEVFCVVGTYDDNDLETLKHETAHGLYFTCPKYKEMVLDSLTGLKARSTKKLEKFLKSNSYHPKVWEDEKHAYLLANSGWLKAHYGISSKDTIRVSKELNILYDNFLSREKIKSAV